MQWDEDLTGPAWDIASCQANTLLVPAGPGTGKTLAMMRLAARFLQSGCPPERILAVTFTRMAARQLVDELGALGVAGCESIQAGTLHSFCFKILARRAVFDVGGRKPRPLLTFNKAGTPQFEVAPLLEDLGSGSGFGDKRNRAKFIRAYEAAWARLQAQEPGWPAQVVDRLFRDALVSWLVFHEAILLGELVPLALEYLKSNPASAERAAFDHIIVDEYQDLNKAEQVLIDLLAQNTSLAVVGDADQSIFRFRYAHPEGIGTFLASHPEAVAKPLTECRRCPTLVVAIADHFVRCDHPSQVEPRLKAWPGKDPGEVHVVQWDSMEGEATGLARYVQYLVNERHFAPADVLILSPRRLIGYGIRDALVALHDDKIGVHSYFHEEALEAHEAQAAFALLTLAARPDDRVALRFWLGFGSTDWRREEYELLRQYCEQSGLSPQSVLSSTERDTPPLRRLEGLRRRFTRLQEELATIQPLRGVDLVRHIFPPEAAWAQGIHEIGGERGADDEDAAALLDRLSTAIFLPEAPDFRSVVRIMSLHKSKGLKSKVVMVAGCIQGLIPNLYPKETPDERRALLEEQRRLFYVALTRTEQILVLSSATSLDRALAFRMGLTPRSRYGAVVDADASSFLGQLGPSAPAALTGTAWAGRGYSTA